MQTSSSTLTDGISGAADFDEGLNQPIVDDRCYTEQFVAILTNQHLQTLRRARRADVEFGTPGVRAPVPIWVNERCVRYQGRSIKDWIKRRTAGPIRPAA